MDIALATARKANEGENADGFPIVSLRESTSFSKVLSRKALINVRKHSAYSSEQEG